MKPSKVLTIYLICSFVLGMILAVPLGYYLKAEELNAFSAATLALCWNVLFVMVLPLILDWSERTYFKARFLKLEELSQTHPEMASVLSEQCEKLALPGLKMAVIDTPGDELFSYGLWGISPRLIMSDSLLKSEDAELIPSIEHELERFSRQDHTLLFLFFTAVQIMFAQVVMTLL